jgi:hypothetical protein
MAVDVKQPKGYRKAWNGDQGHDGLSEGSDRPLGWCRDERIRRGLDVVVEQSVDYTLVHCIGDKGPDNIHAGQWILWDGHGRCYAVGPEEWTRKMRDKLLNGATPPPLPDR